MNIFDNSFEKIFIRTNCIQTTINIIINEIQKIIIKI